MHFTLGSSLRVKKKPMFLNCSINLNFQFQSHQYTDLNFGIEINHFREYFINVLGKLTQMRTNCFRFVSNEYT